MTSEKPFRTLHVGLLGEHENVVLPVARPSRLDLRSEYFRQNPSVPFPSTSIMLLRHVFQVSAELNALHIHIKYVVRSGESVVMFRTPKGLVFHSTIVNSHWIPYVVLFATKKEALEDVEEGEFRIEIISENGLHGEFTCGLLHLHDGIKLTLTPIS
ncbi:Type II secretion system (T2SS)-related protein GspEL3 [Andalucia godoyi]|uniref:Type II secretion system (T2SS)-related protein GspEL3 n=1 Tax=Andalucia godoyi TaxID=505711 RepID=A0A8K0AGW2_ANDGO|nr:Type II secretion system (T2SS)-related protein GspEL3 [Andalucia godoyi]|eukprot:ANDGO_08775.mRNA.1 Type II secretion system (T2SS)-related protein GspEL3